MIRFGTFMSLGVLALLVATPTAAIAQTRGVATVDVKGAMKATKHWKEAFDALTKKKTELETKLEKTRTELKGKVDALVVQRDVLAPVMFREKMGELEKERVALAQELYRSQQILALMERELAGQMVKRIELVVRGLALEKELLLIVDSGDENQPNVLYQKKGTDITKTVVESYEKLFGDKPLRVPEFPEAPPPAASGQ